METALLIGCGAMGRTVLHRLERDTGIRVSYVLVPARRRDALQLELGDAIRVIASTEELVDAPGFAIECAGHDAVHGVVPQLLRQGIDTIVASVGALAEPGLAGVLEQAALTGNAQVILVSGAIAGIDALSAAASTRIESVSYIGRKPPSGWLGTAAEDKVNLAALDEAAVIFEGSARDAARLYPKNANVAAIVALAGIGFERTRVQLIADPAVSRNTHRLIALGEFGELDVTVAARPLADNPKTSALAAYSIIRAARQRARRVLL
jgi:aspartate dehydrogenase